MSEAPLTDREFDAALREDATDEEIGTLLRDLVFWSYLMRDPFDKVCAVGRGTRADATRALAAEARPRSALLGGVVRYVQELGRVLIKGLVRFTPESRHCSPQALMSKGEIDAAAVRSVASALSELAADAERRAITLTSSNNEIRAIVSEPISIREEPLPIISRSTRETADG